MSRYAERWRVENSIAEAVKFFHLNALSSPILVKVHLDVVLTVIADTLYYMLAQKLRGFEECNAPRINRHFIRGKADVRYDGRELRVTYPRRAHNPVVMAAYGYKQTWRGPKLTSALPPTPDIRVPTVVERDPPRHIALIVRQPTHTQPITGTAHAPGRSGARGGGGP